jgi:hypothetical protein
MTNLANETAASRKEPPEMLTGIWDSYSDGYIISAASLEYRFEGQNLNFAGDIKCVTPYGGDRGVIIIEFTQAPEQPYATGNISHLGIYYKVIGNDAVKFANSYDATGTDTLDLAAAMEKFSPEHESSFVFDWDNTYILFRQPAPVYDLGGMKGTWEGDDEFPTWLTISDYRLTVCMVDVSPLTVVYSGTIAEATDPEAATGYISIQFTTDDNTVLETVRAGAFYRISWFKKDERIYFSVYDNSDSAAADTPENLAATGEAGSNTLVGFTRYFTSRARDA